MTSEPLPRRKPDPIPPIHPLPNPGGLTPEALAAAAARIEATGWSITRAATSRA